MKQWWLISKGTIKNIFRLWYVWISILIYLSLSAWLVIVIPWTQLLDGLFKSEQLNMNLMINFVFSSLLFSFVSSAGTPSGLTIFYMSRPINRSAYFYAKLLTIFTICLLISIVYIGYWLIIHTMIYNHFDDHHLNILDGKYYVSLVQIIIPLILLTVFSSVIGISLKYYAKSIFSILICVIIGFSPIFFWLSPALNHIYEYQKYANWSLLFFPCIVFSISSIFVVVFAIFSTKYMKINI